MDDYISAFTKLSCRASDWSDDQLLPIFCGGLKSEIRHDVLALNPLSLAEAQHLARRFEAKLNDIRATRTHLTRNWQYSPRPPSGPHASAPLPISNFGQSQPPSHWTPQTNSGPSTMSTNRPRQDAISRRWSPAEQRERRAKGLCFHCDEAYSPHHVCKKPLLAILECPIAPESQQEPPEHSEHPEDDPIDPEPTYPLHSITHTKIGEMMRFYGTINDLPIDIFIDCGSAMNFLNPGIAQQLHLPISTPTSLSFTTASGQTLSPSGLASNVTVKIQEYTFNGSFLLLPVVGCDLLLGAQWLDTLGFIGWHFLEKVMMFTANGKCHVLHGLTNQPPSFDSASFCALLPSDQLDAIMPLSTHVVTQIQTTPYSIRSLLTTFQELFSTPTGLPPSRPIDHCIPLLPNINPINVHTYRYAHSKKAELESQVKDMLS